MSDRYTVQVGDGQCSLFIRDGRDSSAYCMPPTATHEDAHLLARRLNERELPTTFSEFEARMRERLETNVRKAEEKAREVNEYLLSHIVAYCIDCGEKPHGEPYWIYTQPSVAEHRACGHVVIERPKEQK